jgi:glycosyltransferase involved in cell wall biosynthesis
MGMDRSAGRQGIYKIHEYLSPSTPPFRSLKDSLKRVLNGRPDLRIYINDYTRQCLAFNDAVPFCLKNMGIPSKMLPGADPVLPKEFDFIYIGDLSSQRKPHELLQAFTRPNLRHNTLLLLSRDYDRLQLQYRAFSNIIFKGPVTQPEVKDFILRSRFGLNYIPDIEPFNQLPSTKLLEYAACGIPVVSTNYRWVRDFMKDHGGQFLLLSAGMKELSWETVTHFQYSSPDMRGWAWEQQLRGSGVLAALQARFPDISF